MKRNFSRRCVLWVAVLVLALTLGAFAIVASAEETTFDYSGYDYVITKVTVDGTETVINSDASITQAVAEANAYAAANGTDKRIAIELGGDITYSVAAALSVSCDLTINLNGHSLGGTRGYGLFSISDSRSLTVTGKGTLWHGNKLAGGAANSTFAVVADNKGDITLKHDGNDSVASSNFIDGVDKVQLKNLVVDFAPHADGTARLGAYFIKLYGSTTASQLEITGCDMDLTGADCSKIENDDARYLIWSSGSGSLDVRIIDSTLDASGLASYLANETDTATQNPTVFRLDNTGETTFTMTNSTVKCKSSLLLVNGSLSTVTLTDSKLFSERNEALDDATKQQSILFDADTVGAGSTFTATNSEFSWAWRGFRMKTYSYRSNLTFSFDNCRFRMANTKLGGGDGFAFGRAIVNLTVKNSVLEFDNAELGTGAARDFDLSQLAPDGASASTYTMENNLLALTHEAPNALTTYKQASGIHWLPTLTSDNTSDSNLIDKLVAGALWKSLDDGAAYPYLYGSLSAVQLWTTEYEACGYTTAGSNFTDAKIGALEQEAITDSNKWGASEHGAQGDNKYYKFYYEASQFENTDGWTEGVVPNDAFFGIPISYGYNAPVISCVDYEYFTIDFELMTETDFIDLAISLIGRTSTPSTVSTNLFYLSYNAADRSLRLSSDKVNTALQEQTITGIDPYRWLHFTVVIRVALTEEGTAADPTASRAMLYLDGQPLYEQAYVGGMPAVTNNLHSLRITTNPNTSFEKGATVCIDNVTSRAYARSPKGVAVLDAVLANTRTAGKTLDQLGYTTYRTYNDRYEVKWVEGDETLKSGRYTTGATATYQDAAATQDGYVQTVGRWDDTAYAAYTIAADKTFTRTEVRRTYVEGMKQNLSLFSDFDINLYIPLLEGETLTVTATAGGDALPMREVTLDGVRYWCVTLGCASNATVDTVSFYLRAEGAGLTRVSLSVVNYASRVLASDEAEMVAAKPLMMYMLTYSRAAYAYFAGQEGDDVKTQLAAIDALLTEENKTAYMGEELTYPTAVNTKQEGSVLYSAALVLESAPTLRFYFNAEQTAGNFAGTVKFTYVDYRGVTRTCVKEVTADQAYVDLSELRVYNFDATLTVETAATGEDYQSALSYNLSSYVGYAETLEDESLCALTSALADYVRVAAAYKTAN